MRAHGLFSPIVGRSGARSISIRPWRLLAVWLGILGLAFMGPAAAADDVWHERVTAEAVAAWADATFQTALRDEGIDAAVIAVTKGGETLFEKGYGFADAVEQRRAGPTTPFRSGSVSKVFTAIALMQLVERRLVGLDDDIKDHLTRAEVETSKGTTTIRHLLTHTAGFDERFRNTLMAAPEDPRADAAYIRDHAHLQVRTPGRIVSYSNHGMGLAGLIVEDVSGLALGDYIQENIFAALRMENAAVEEPGRLPETIAKEHDLAPDGRPVPRRLLYKAPFYLGSGGFYYSARDMAAFMKAVLTQSPLLLERASWQSVLGTQKLVGEGLGGGIGLGFWIYELAGVEGSQSAATPSIIGHGGWTRGFKSQLFLFPRERIGLFLSVLDSDFPKDGGSFSPWRAVWEFERAFRSGARDFADWAGPDDPPLEAFAGLFLANRRPYSGPEFFLDALDRAPKRLTIEDGVLHLSETPLRRIGARSFATLHEGRSFVVSFSDDLGTMWSGEASSYTRTAALDPVLRIPEIIAVLFAVGSSVLLRAAVVGRRADRHIDVAIAAAAGLSVAVIFVPVVALALGDEFRLASPRYAIQLLVLCAAAAMTLVAAWSLLRLSQPASETGPNTAFTHIHRAVSLLAVATMIGLYLAYDLPWAPA